ncbi:E3 ubiquitin-protein ligase listerin [Bienertia sinuspersici]
MQMTYRCRGGRNGTGGIMRGPRKPLFQPMQTTNLENSDDADQDDVEQNEQQSVDAQSLFNNASPTLIPCATPSQTLLDTSMITTANGTTQPDGRTPSTSLNLTHTNVDNTLVISDETGNPSKLNAILHPEGELWFTKREVVKKVTKTSYKQYFDKPYNNWSMVLKDIKQRWWYVAKLVRIGWEEKLKRRLTDIVSKLVRKDDYQLKLCPSSLKAGLKQIRDTPEFKKKSAQCSANKKNSVKGLSLHCQGSIVELGGQKPKPSDVFKRGHLKKNGDFDTLQHKEAANMESDRPKTNEEVYFEVVGGFDAKGRIYGIGSAAESYFEKPNSIKTTTKASSQHVMNLENQVTQLTSTNKQQQELLDSTVEQMKLLQKQFEILSQQVTACSPPPTPTPSFGSS